MTSYTNTGYIQKGKNGFEGEITIEDIVLSPIEGKFFVYKKDKRQYLCLKRKPILEYNQEIKRYETRPREPRWETYLQRQDNDNIPYVGTFVFLHFKFKIQGTWDLTDMGKKTKKMNLFIERLPMQEQTIINTISERKCIM